MGRIFCKAIFYLENINKKKMGEFISYLSSIPDAIWPQKVMGAWDLFEARWATTFMIYPVNDGIPLKWMNFKYDQATPRERIIAYLENLRDGKEKSTQDLM